MRKHLVIPDVQVKDGHDFAFLEAAGNFIAEKKPDVVIQIGDFADMESLSSYDKGKKSFEGRRYKKDIEAAKEAMYFLTEPIRKESEKLVQGRRKRWKPRQVLTLGNHEHRIDRAINEDPKLDGVLSVNDLCYSSFGWEVHTFLDVAIVDGIAYSHYFTTGVMGRAVTSARVLLSKKHMSAVMGHHQHWDIARDVRADGIPIIGLFCGSFYEHNEDYLGPQGNSYDRGIWMFHEVVDGSFQPMYISLKYLKDKYL